MLIAENFDMMFSFWNRLAKPTQANCDLHPPPVDAHRSVGAGILICEVVDSFSSVEAYVDGVNSKRMRKYRIRCAQQLDRYFIFARYCVVGHQLDGISKQINIQYKRRSRV